jgi:hypothetical protein
MEQGKKDLEDEMGGELGLWGRSGRESGEINGPIERNILGK